MKSNWILGAILASTLLFSACKRDFAIDPADKAEMEAYLQEEFDRLEVPALSVTVFRESNVLFASHLGQADRENNVLLNENHYFLLASVSKTITGVALLQLYEQGRFGLDDPINDYLPFKVAHPESNKAITFRHLFTHTSSIIEGDAVDGAYFYGVDSPVDLGAFLQSYLTPGGADYDERDNYARQEPGEKYIYSNTGSALMGYLVTRISGMDFNDYCKQNIFTPLGMTRTAWHLREVDTTQIVRPYEVKRGDYLPLQHYAFTDYPNGGLRSTGLDLARFLGACANGGVWQNHRLLNAATLGEALKAQVPNLEAGQGLAFYEVIAAEGLWGHNGGEAGVSTVVVFNPVTHVGAIVLTNVEDIDLDDIALSGYRLGLKL